MKMKRKRKEIRLQRKVLPYGVYPKNWSKEMKLAQATRHYNIMKDSVEMVEETLSEDVFRNRYEAAVREAQIVISLCGRSGIGIRAERALRYLLNRREQITNEFMARCREGVRV